MTSTTEGNPKAEAAPAPKDLDKLMQVNQLLIRTLGEAVSLMVPVAKYQQMTIADIRARVLPPIVLRQCRLFRQKGFPVAFISWALLSDEAEMRLRADPLQITPQDWRSGSRLHFVDVASPKGREEEIKDIVRRDLSGVRPNGSAEAGKDSE